MNKTEAVQESLTEKLTALEVAERNNTAKLELIAQEKASLEEQLEEATLSAQHSGALPVRFAILTTKLLVACFLATGLLFL